MSYNATSNAKKTLSLLCASTLAIGLSVPVIPTMAQASEPSTSTTPNPAAFMSSDEPMEPESSVTYATDDDNHVPQELIITYEDDAMGLDETQTRYIAPETEPDAMGPVPYSKQDVSLATIGASGQSALGETPASGSESLVKLNSEVDINSAIEEISELDGVTRVQPNYTYELMGVSRTSKYSKTGSELPVNDHYADYYADDMHQVYLYNTHAACLWDRGIRSDGSGSVNSGRTVSVAVMDTAPRYNHPDLVGNLDLQNGRDFVTDKSAADGLPITDANTDAMSAKWDNGTLTAQEYHGTCVSGYVSAQANNEEGIAGMSYNANIIPLVVSDAGSFSTSDVIRALGYLDKKIEDGTIKDLHVINMSFGGTGQDAAFHERIKHLYSEHDVLCVAAAGNLGNAITSPNTVLYPCAWDEVLGVMATDAGGNYVASFSCYGDGTNVSAPGQDVTSTYPFAYAGGDSWSTVEAYRYRMANMNGTSYASPIVAGGVSLLFAGNPSATAKQVKEAIVSTGREMTSVDANCRPFVDFEAAYCSLAGLSAPAEDETYIPPAHVHDWADSSVIVEPSCTVGGQTQQMCAGCGETQVVDTSALGHEWKLPEWEWSDDNNACTATFTCVRDSSHVEIITADVEVTESDDSYTYTATLVHDSKPFTRITSTPKTPSVHVHSWSEPVIVLEPDCANTGLSRVTCKDCGQMNDTDIPALGHQWENPEWAWTDDLTSCSASFKCSRNSSHVETVTTRDVSRTETTTSYVYHATVEHDGSTYTTEKEVTKPAVPHQHEWYRDEVTTQPGCASTGVRTYYCKCGETRTETIPQVGHVWQEPSWSWGSDRSTCTAIFQCKNDSSHTSVYKAIVTSKRGENKTIYTATVTCNDGKTYQNTVEIADAVVKPDPEPKPDPDPEPEPNPKPDPEPDPKPEPPAEKQLVADGVYTIATALAPAKVLDIASGSISNYANVQLWASNGTGAQKFSFAYEKTTNSYVITNVQSGKPIQVSGTVKSGANVNQQSADGKKSQRWKITQDANGYKITSLANASIVLDLSGAVASDGRNVQVWTSNDTKAQRWKLTKINVASPIIANGTYYINSKVGSNKVLDISAASTANGANAQIWTKNNTAAQRFIITYNWQGYYTIKNVKSGKVLDAQCGGTGNGTNVWQYAVNGTDAQQWRITKNTDGTYSLANRKSGKMLDVNAGANKNGVNVHLWTGNGTAAQKWTFAKA